MRKFIAEVICPLNVESIKSVRFFLEACCQCNSCRFGLKSFSKLDVIWSFFFGAQIYDRIFD